MVPLDDVVWGREGPRGRVETGGRGEGRKQKGKKKGRGWGKGKGEEECFGWG